MENVKKFTGLQTSFRDVRQETAREEMRK